MSRSDIRYAVGLAGLGLFAAVKRQIGRAHV